MDTVLGQVCKPGQTRDAIHVAVIPVIINENSIDPGTKVRFAIKGNNRRVRSIDWDDRDDPTIIAGVIDPFLQDSPQFGQEVFMLLPPNTVTGMRHHWESADFPDIPVVSEDGLGARDPESISKRWIEEFAADINMSYEKLMDAARLQADKDESTHNGSDQSYGNRSDWKEFWKHYEIVTGECPKHPATHFFSCAC